MPKDLNFFSKVNWDLLDRIPLTSKKVVEVGCGAADMAAVFKNRSPDCQYIGIEQSSDFAEIAQNRLDKLIISDFESDIDLPDNIDCLIYNNVLEKLNDPEEYLDRHVKKLNDTSTLMACIYNFQYWRLIKQLIYGNCQLNEDDIFANTYRKSFNLKNIKDLFLSLGLTLIDVKPRIFNEREIDNFVDNMQPALINFGIKKESFKEYISPFQYIIRAAKNKPKRIQINYLKLPLDVNGLSMSRIEESLKSLSSIPGINCNIYEKPTLKLSTDTKDKIKILMSYRPKYNTNYASAIELIIKNNYLLIVDFDDHPNIIQDKLIRDFTFKCCHAIFTTNNSLANVFKKYNPEVFVFQNNILSINPRNYIHDNKIKVFFGAINRENDWRPWIDTLNAVLTQDTNKWYFEVIHDKKFFNEINLPQEQKSFTPVCEYHKYLEIMSKCDVAFMPLQNTLFNLCKSDLKAVQAASYSLSILSTPVVYSNNFIDKKTATFFTTKQELFQILNTWSHNQDLIRDIGRNAQQYVSQNRLYTHQIDNKIECFRDLWERRENLSGEILKRIAKFQ